ncbi:hypothetical protein KCU81_g8191, partial [Aureobasidium melanogenum]|uniref:Uncharacterized protein n=1 Tax=Aureobasidium melanogenum (strain CBS 110374) TaxID=1043003 RepID=A0A074VZD7_AURM1
MKITDNHDGLESEMDNDDYNAVQYFDGADDELTTDVDQDKVDKETSLLPGSPARALEFRPKRGGGNNGRVDGRGARRGGRGGRALVSWARRGRTISQHQVTIERPLEFGTEIVVLKAKGETNSHVSKTQFDHAVKLIDHGTYDIVKDCEGVSIRHYNFEVHRSIVRFFDYWIHYHDSQDAHAAIEYALERKKRIDINNLKPKLSAESGWSSIWSSIWIIHNSKWSGRRP